MTSEDDFLDWVYLNRFGWFVRKDGIELDMEAAREMHRQGNALAYIAPTHDAEPRWLGKDFTLAELVEVCRHNEENWVV